MPGSASIPSMVWVFPAPVGAGGAPDGPDPARLRPPPGCADPAFGGAPLAPTPCGPDTFRLGNKDTRRPDSLAAALGGRGGVGVGWSGAGLAAPPAPGSRRGV